MYTFARAKVVAVFGGRSFPNLLIRCQNILLVVGKPLRGVVSKSAPRNELTLLIPSR